MTYPVQNMAMGRASLSAAMIPVFDVELRNGKNVKVVQAGLDSGLTAAHLKIPKELAEDLGLAATGTMMFQDASGSGETQISKMTLISAANGKCSLANGKVLISGDMVLLGQPFLAATGSVVNYYDNDTVGLACLEKGSPGSVGVFPQFSLELSNGGNRITETAVVDTGFEGGLAVPESVAEKLKLVKTGSKKWITHEATVEMGISSIGRVGFPGSKKCGVSNLSVAIWPASARLQPVMVGEKFLAGLGGSAIGYDKDGVVLACFSGNEAMRAAKSVYLVTVSPEFLSDPSNPTMLAPLEDPIVWPWVVGGAISVGGLAWWILGKPS